MKLSKLAILAFVVLLPAICHAKGTCPWINEATAFGVLGGSAHSPASLSEVSPTSCNFVYKDTASSRSLLVTVEVATDPGQAFNAYKAQCGSHVNPLPAIGNEAVLCSGKKNHIAGEQVVGRVRDNVFTIKLSTNAKNDPAMARDALEQKARLVAEQVAGNLF